MHNPILLDHFQNPRNVGALPPPAVIVEANNPACGDIMQLSLLVDQDLIRDVRFKTRGCVAAIACGSILSELIKGKSLEDARRVTAADVAKALGGLPPESGHASILAEDALKAASKAAETIRR